MESIVTLALVRMVMRRRVVAQKVQLAAPNSIGKRLVPAQQGLFGPESRGSLARVVDPAVVIGREPRARMVKRRSAENIPLIDSLGKK